VPVDRLLQRKPPEVDIMNDATFPERLVNYAMTTPPDAMRS